MILNPKLTYASVKYGLGKKREETVFIIFGIVSKHVLCEHLDYF